MIGIIHIGAEKTGTTTLQEFFFLNREKLTESGVFFPRSPGQRQHSLLALYAMDSARENLLSLGMTHALGGGRDVWKSTFAAKLSAEIPKKNARHLLISTELFHSQLVSLDEVRRLKALLDTWCTGYRILFYMRRQDWAAASRYSTQLRTGGTPDSILEIRANPARLYDYNKILVLWEAVFSGQAIVPRLFDDESMHRDGLIADFVSAAGLPLDIATMTWPTRRNTALSGRAQRLLLKYNRCATLENVPERERIALQRNVVQFLERAFPGAPALPSRQEAIDFYAPYRDGNARIARKWFNRELLFQENFSNYPERADPPPPLAITKVMRFSTRLARYLLASSFLIVTCLSELLTAAGQAVLEAI